MFCHCDAAGAGIYSLMIVYCLGNLLAALLAFSIMTRRFCVPLVAFDLKFMKHNLLRGVPFFSPGLFSCWVTSPG